MLAPSIETEIATLAARYGAPQRIAVDLRGGPFRPLSATDRIGEVCMVVRRTNGKLLTAVKTFYPPGAFRLLTGGIKHGEAIADALLRETAEETGLDVVVRRFLAVIEYHLVGDAGQEPAGSACATAAPAFATFAFLLDEVSGTLAVQDAEEQLGAFHEAAIDELPALAERLEHVPDGFHPEIRGSWQDWGRFRAVVHRVVYDALLHDQPRGLRVAAPNRSPIVAPANRAWLTRIALSLLFAAAAGTLAYLVARAVTSLILFVRQQQFLGEVAGALRGGIMGLAGGDLRAMRLLVEQLDAQNEQLSALIGFAVAAVAIVASYLWLEWRAAS